MDYYNLIFHWAFLCRQPAGVKRPVRSEEAQASDRVKGVVAFFWVGASERARWRTEAACAAAAEGPASRLKPPTKGTPSANKCRSIADKSQRTERTGTRDRLGCAQCLLMVNQTKVD